MHKFVLKSFHFLRNFVDFIKIAAIFCILMLTLYWIQNLIGSYWAWMGFITPLLDFFLTIGGKITTASIMLFAAVFEFKYLIVLLIFLSLYFISNYAQDFINYLEETYFDIRQNVRKSQEDRFNKSIQKKNAIEQQSLKKFQIYVSLYPKDKIAHRELKVNIDEQNLMMNKFLMEKTKASPKKYQNGFLYTFENFNDIDIILDVFMKLLNSSAPVNYNICATLITNDTNKAMSQLETLISLKISNKIIMLSDMSFRYEFNENSRYETSQLGIYQKERGTFEVHQFLPIS